MEQLEGCRDGAEARATILAVAERGGLATALAMLAEAIDQLEGLAPGLSAEIWDSYSAILARHGCIDP